MVDEGFDAGDRAGADGREVGAFAEVTSELAVEVFDGAFLPGAVGVGVVDRGADDAFEGGGAEELAPVVGEQRLHGLQLLLAHEFLEGGADGFLADFGEFDGVGFAGLAFGEGEEAALPASAGVDGVHFPDAEGLLAAEKGFGHVQDGVAGGQRLATRPFRSEGLTRLRLPFSGSHEASIPAQERPAVMRL